MVFITQQPDESYLRTERCTSNLGIRAYRGGSNWDASSWPTGTTGTADPTTWEFDANSGLLWKKTDAGSQVVEFDYNTRGQIETRKWARTLPSSSTKLSATYGYSSTTGELTSVDYNDSTPDVGYTYNRLGQLATVTDYVGTRTFVQNTSAPWRNEREAFPAFYDSRWLTRAYDATTGTGSTLGSHTPGTFAGRYAGYDLGNSGDSDADLRVRQVYSNQQRFAAVRATVGSGTQQDFIYAYEANSRLIDGYVTGSNFAVSRDYESARDLVSRLETKWGSTTTLARFDYTHTAAGRRKTAQQRGTAFADYFPSGYTSVFNHYGYNSRGELETAAMYRGDTIPAVTATPNSTDELPGRRFEYRYDSIGNRTTSGQTGSAGTADDEYTADARNRYTARENNTVRVTGTAAAAATVVVAGASSTNKKDRAWAADFVPANSTGPSKGSATVYAALVGGGSGGADLIKTLGTPSWFVPAAAQSFSYDADGNLTADGVWNYDYDAENRLIAMEHRSEAIGTGKIATVDARRLEFRYDYQGRRVIKTVRRSWNGSSYATWDSARKFLYDGWNVIAEFSVPSEGSGTVTLARSYYWGLDLAGSLEATGGVGALLQMRDHATSKTYWPAYDGNGNVVALVNAATSDLAAVYEYDPFGQPIRSETLDSTVNDNPWRFSTKFTDVESGLVYYGHRYYSAPLGRFINRDPIGEQGGLNLYAFARNDAINGLDYLGLDFWSRMPQLWRGADDFGKKEEKPTRMPDYPVTGDRYVSAWELSKAYPYLPGVFSFHLSLEFFLAAEGPSSNRPEQDSKNAPNKTISNFDCDKIKKAMAGDKTALAELKQADAVLGGSVAAGADLFRRAEFMSQLLATPGIGARYDVRHEFGASVSRSGEVGPVMQEPTGHWPNSVTRSDPNGAAFVHTHPYWQGGRSGNFSASDINWAIETGRDIYVVGAGGAHTVFSPAGQDPNEIRTTMAGSRGDGNLDNKTINALQKMGALKGCK